MFTPPAAYCPRVAPHEGTLRPVRGRLMLCANPMHRLGRLLLVLLLLYVPTKEVCALTAAATSHDAASAELQFGRLLVVDLW